MTPKILASKIPIPIVENRDNVNSDFKTVAQNNNQHLCLDVVPCMKKRPVEYIWTFNGSAKIILKVPQTLASLSIIAFIADSYCVLCRTSSKDNITNKTPKKLKLEHKAILDRDRRYLTCKNCRERGCDICLKLFYAFLHKCLFLSQITLG